MKILGINGSPRGTESRTRQLVEAVLTGARDEGAETEYIDVCALDIDYCTGCGVCYECGECVLEDDFSVLFEKMIDADGVVLGSPNYINSVTAQIKTVIDRLADAIHCQMFLGKYGCAVSTAGGSGADEVVAYLNSVQMILGASVVGGVGAVIGNDPRALEGAIPDARKLGKALARAIATQERYPEQDEVHAEMHERMKYLVLAQKDIWSHQYEYWKNKGWFDE